MSISMTRNQAISYYKELGEPIPEMLKKAKKKDVFAFGFTIRNGVCGSAPLHKIGDDPGPLGDFLSIHPHTKSEVQKICKKDRERRKDKAAKRSKKKEY